MSIKFDICFYKLNWKQIYISLILHPLDPSMPLIQKLDTGDVTTCKAIGQVANIPGMDKWCTDNCPNNCPETYCSCKFRHLITSIQINVYQI